MAKKNPTRFSILKSDSAEQQEAPVQNAFLLETAWEVCNQVGGIHTVIKSKVPNMVARWGDNYCLLGPMIHPTVSAIFEPDNEADNPFARAARRMREAGLDAHYGRWLVDGRPQTVLFNPFSVFDRLGDIKYTLWDQHQISTPGEHKLLNEVLGFGFLTEQFILQLAQDEAMESNELIAHFHEWMAGTCIPGIRKNSEIPKIVFTTHATILGRYLAMNDPEFYANLPFYDWQKEAKHFNIEAEANFERAAAHGAHVFTTVSEVTGRECQPLLGRKPDVILPNGFNINRFVAAHEIQNLHQDFKEDIQKFIVGHFFSSTPFDLDKTLFFFTSGRYEYQNKGFDMTLEALARLNHRLKEEGSDMTIVMFFITKAPIHSINPEVLEARAMVEEIRQNVEAITHEVGSGLFEHVLSSNNPKMPDLTNFVSDYWRLRLRRTLQKWKGSKLPPVVTHNLVDSGTDKILNFVRKTGLINHADDRVKIVYHPDFISATNPLFGIDYDEFVRGCHLGVFPSFYEPWGYTPLECMASGVPSITSNLSGFGDYSLKLVSSPENHGLYVVNRRDLRYGDAAQLLAENMYHFVSLNRRERIEQRYQVERFAMNFDWNNLTKHYDQAYRKAVKS
ncbi:MAG: glycosyltransferase [Bacteroidia bacterium]